MDGQVLDAQAEAPGVDEVAPRAGWWDLTKQVFLTYIVVSTLTSFMIGRRGGPERSTGPVITSEEARQMSAARTRQQMHQQEARRGGSAAA